MKLKPQTKKAILSDDDDEDMKDPSEDESPVKPVARRPARAAATAKSKKPVYIDSDEDDIDIDDLDESAVVEQDESEDFDDSE
jgi:DNA topoisomerase-2